MDFDELYGPATELAERAKHPFSNDGESIFDAVDRTPVDFRLVNASAGIGDVNGDGYGVTSGWLGKTLRYHGEGKYELRAHVGVGDIRLEGK